LQWAVGNWLEHKLSLSIPPAGWLPALQGLGVGMIVVLAFGAPPVLALRRVSAMRVLRRDLDGGEPSAWLVALAGLAGIAVLLWWKAGSAELAGVMLLGIDLAGAALALATARQPALRAGECQSPRRYQHCAGVGTRPRIDGVVIADIRAHRPAQPLAVIAVGEHA
jgi:predicted lysophospholipase L1 biosynthesis ABC-type transport system permease subunit